MPPSELPAASAAGRLAVCAMTTATASTAAAYWRRTFSGLTGYIACFSGVRNGKKLEKPETKFYPYPVAVENAAAWLQGEAAAGREAYAAASLFTDNKKRDKRLSADIATLWTDGDGATIPAGFPQPTITVETSPGRWNYLWVLTHAIAPDQAEDLNRRIAYAIGADKGGWDIGQLLRVPGLPNFKYEGAPTVTVTDDSGPIHDPTELLTALPAAPADAARKRTATGNANTVMTTSSETSDEPPIRGMNAELWRGKWLTTTADEDSASDDPLVFSTGTIDRSRVLWHIACDAEEHGASEALIAWVIEDRDKALGFNKFTERSDMYRQQAKKVIDRERTPQATVTLGGRVLGGPAATEAAQDDRTAVRQAFDEAKERRRRQKFADLLRYRRAIRRLARDRGLSDGDKVTAIVMADVTAQWARTPSPIDERRLYLKKQSEESGVARATFSKRVDDLARTGVYTVRRQTTRGPIINPETGRPVMNARTGEPVIGHDTKVLVTPKAAGTEFLEAVISRTYATDPEAMKERPKKKARGVYCHKHPEAAIVMETRVHWFCKTCSQAVKQPMKHEREFAPDAPPANGVLRTKAADPCQTLAPPTQHVPAEGVPAFGAKDHRDRDQTLTPPNGAQSSMWQPPAQETPLPNFGTPPAEGGGTFQVMLGPPRLNGTLKPPQELVDELAAAGGDP